MVNKFLAPIGTSRVYSVLDMKPLPLWQRVKLLFGYRLVTVVDVYVCRGEISSRAKVTCCAEPHYDWYRSHEQSVAEFGPESITHLLTDCDGRKLLPEDVANLANP